MDFLRSILRYGPNSAAAEASRVDDERGTPSAGTGSILGRMCTAVFGTSNASTISAPGETPASQPWSVRSYLFNSVRFEGTLVPKSGSWRVAIEDDQDILTASLEKHKNAGIIENYNGDQTRIKKTDSAKSQNLETAIQQIAKSAAPSHSTALQNELKRLCHQGFLGSFTSNANKLNCFTGNTYFAKGNYDCSFSFQQQGTNQIVITAQGTANPQLASLDQKGLQRPLTSTSKQVEGTITLAAVATFDPASGKIIQLSFKEASGTWNILPSQKKGWLW